MTDTRTHIDTKDAQFFFFFFCYGQATKDRANCCPEYFLLFDPMEMVNGARKPRDSSGSFKVKGNYRCQPIITRATRDTRLSDEVAGKWTCTGSR